MTTRHETSDRQPSGSLTLDVRRQLDQICNRFESDWKTGKRPNIDDFLGDWADEHRSHLLMELIPLDIHHRRLQGEEPKAEEYERRFPSLDQAWLASAVGSDDSPPLSSTISYRAVVPQVRAGKYTVKKFHARGGMGEIWTADDCEIGREVALKKIRQDRAKQSARFLAEAQITGQMEHPGIVPVHELALDESGSPFYVMKFVHGRSLKEVIDEFHSPGRINDSSREVERLRLLEIFVDLCHTAAYAHSRGVLHRDLKPDNVMVGAFGETLVVDWGLAKVMHQSELPGGGSYVHSTYTEHSEETAAGSVLGAPAYMAPEMAEGHSADVDQRTDIYLLGSTLYSILTGEPPRSGKSHDELVELARTVPPPPPRKLVRSIPRALDAICLKAMSRRREDRYSTAMALAEDVQHYLAGEPVSAYRESLPERAWRWARRHRQGLAWTAAAVVMLAVTATAGVKIYDAQEAARRAIVRAESEEKEKEKVKAREQARLDLARFRTLADEVQFLAANRDAVAERAPYYDPRQGEARAREALAIVEPWGPKLERFALNDEAELVADVKREIYDLMILLAQVTSGRADAAAAKVALALLDRAQTIGAPSRSYYRLRAECLRLLGDNDAAQEADRKAEDPSTPMTARDYFLLAETHRNQSSPDPAAPHQIGQPNPELERAIELYGQAIEKKPNHFWSHLQRGRCLFALGQKKEAIGSLSAAIALRPDSPWGYTTRGLVYAMNRRFDDALSDLDRVLSEHTEFRPARLNRGIVYWMRKEYDAAEADFSEVLKPQNDRRLVEAAYYRAQVYLDQAKYREALADIGLVVGVNPSFRPAYLSRARAHFALRDETLGLGALDSYLAGQPGFDANKPEAHAQRGELLRRLRRGWALPQPARSDTNALIISELNKAVARDIRTPQLFNDRGAMFATGKQYKEAEAEYSKGLELATDHPTLRNNRGWAYIELKQYDKARDDFAVAARLQPKTPAEFIARAEAHSGLGLSYAALGSAVDAQQAAARAWAFLEQGPEHYQVWHNIACIYGVLAKSSQDGSQDNYTELVLEFFRRAIKSGDKAAINTILGDKDYFPTRIFQSEEWKKMKDLPLP